MGIPETEKTWIKLNRLQVTTATPEGSSMESCSLVGVKSITKTKHHANNEIPAVVEVHRER